MHMITEKRYWSLREHFLIKMVIIPKVPISEIRIIPLMFHIAQMGVKFLLNLDNLKMVIMQLSLKIHLMVSGH